MKFKTKTIATLLGSTALATMIGMGSAYAEDKDEDPGTGAPQEEQPQGDGVAPSTGMGGALQEEEPRHDDMAPQGGHGQGDLPAGQIENMGEEHMDMDDERMHEERTDGERVRDEDLDHENSEEEHLDEYEDKAKEMDEKDYGDNGM